MAALFYIFLAIAISTACWQFVRIFQYTGIIANDSDNKNQGRLMLAFLFFNYGLMIYCFLAYKDVLLPKSASVEGDSIDLLYVITMALIIVVQFIVQFVLFWFAFRYTGKKETKALYYTDSHKLELIWTTVPAIVLAIIIVFGMITWTNIMWPDEEDALVIELYAKQFSWEARYAGNDGSLGKANVRFIEGVNTMGVDLSDKSSKDDIPSSTLYLPKGRKVIFKFRSQDVLHSAYMPHFRAQMNCVPGTVTQFAFTPSVSTIEMRKDPVIVAKVKKINKIRKQKNVDLAKKGEDLLEAYVFDYMLLCNKICGATHYNMQMKIIVEEENDFNSWLKSQKTIAEVLAKK